jgi:hypothetical protein
MAFGNVFTITFKVSFTFIAFFNHVAKLKNNQQNDKILIIKFYLWSKFKDYDW